MFKTDQPNFITLGQIVAERSRPLVAWMGAGLSAPAGLPSWRKLRDMLCNALRQKAEGSPDKGSMLALLDSAKAQSDFWISFRILREGLGAMTYQHTIRSALQEADRATVPAAYKSLWKLRLSGILNLNLDRLATRAFTEVHGSKSMVEFPGRDSGAFAHVLSNPTVPFIANLHGTHADVTSWVFTDEELNALMQTAGYIELLTACILSQAILFIGILAEDFAAGGHLTRIRERKIDASPHFWITDRRDRETVQWAEKSGILLIHYSNPDNSHAELQDCIDKLLQFLPNEPPATPVLPLGMRTTGAILPTPSELLRVDDADVIRYALNAEAVRLLKEDSQDSYRAYEDFCALYEEAIHRAWFIPRRPEGTNILGYQIIRRIMGGGFGTVYEVEDQNGDRVALKLLHESIRAESEHLQSFRRGIRSMRFLSEADVPGTVRYHNAFEIPAFVVMDLVPGPTLQTVVMQRPNMGWDMVLEIAYRLVRIIRKSHQLPKGVMHRDIRPPNIMFKEEWSGADNWDIVVLDFDLSWHKDAQEKSIAIESYSGYLAPEQVIRDGRYTTRSTLVDSYGLGMTLFFLRTRAEPTFLQPGQAGWEDLLETLARSNPCREWVSLPRRYFRLLMNCTYFEQSKRWDVSQIEAELKRMKAALLEPQHVESADLMAEELMARTFPNQYLWDPDTATAVRQVISETRLSVSGDESIRSVRLHIGWTQTGEHHIGKTTKWAQDVGGKITEMLLKDRWELLTVKKGREGILITAVLAIDSLALRLSECSKTLARVSATMIRK